MGRDMRVSVVIDNYNYANYLRKAIDSALNQKWRDVEVIVVDDGSTDASRDIIATYRDRIRPVLQPNRGQAAAFNAGVALATGEIICLLDSDDVWFPNKIERVVAAFDEYPDAAWLRHRLRVVDVKDRPLGASIPPFRGTRLRTPEPLAFIEGCFPAPTSAVALRASLARRVFPIPEMTEPNGPFHGVDLMRDADAYVLYRAASTGLPFLSLDEELGLYVRHPHQRYVSEHDIVPILERQIALGAGVATAFSERLGRSVVPSSVHKHRAILAALSGRSLFAAERLKPAMAGMRTIMPLAVSHPKLFARQLGALGLGTLAPRMWLKKLMRQQGFLKGKE